MTKLSANVNKRGLLRSPPVTHWSGLASGCVSFLDFA